MDYLFYSLLLVCYVMYFHVYVYMCIYIVDVEHTVYVHDVTLYMYA